MALRRKRGGKTVQQPTVLLVEPRAEELERTRLRLGEAGFRVVPLTRFDAVVPLFEVIRPDAVVLAVQPPDFSAVALVRRLKQLSRGAVPLLYLVDPHDAQSYRYCLEKGQCVDVVPRSGSGAELALKLHAQLRLKDSVLRAAEADESGTPMVLHDPLTGVYNRAFLLALVGLETRRAERYGGGFCLVACGLNGFKAFRKEYGQGLSERLLVYSAVVLGQVVREADTVARVGEEEFALLLQGTPSEALPEVLSRVLARFEGARFQVEGKVLRVAVSLGAVSFPDTVGTPVQLLGGALQDMRRSRDARRLSGGPPSGPGWLSV